LDEPIDLLNIAFENPRKIRAQIDGNVGGIKKKNQRAIALKDSVVEDHLSGRYNPDYLVPDRITGLSELEELRRLCPGRQWNFVRFYDRIRTYRLTMSLQVEVDVPYTEYQGAQETMKSIMWPCQTIMDLVSGVFHNHRLPNLLICNWHRVFRWHYTSQRVALEK